MRTKCQINREPTTELERLYFQILTSYHGCTMVCDKKGEIIFWSGPDPYPTFGISAEKFSSGITVHELMNITELNTSPTLIALQTGHTTREMVVPVTGVFHQMYSTPLLADDGSVKYVITFCEYDDVQSEATEFFHRERERYQQILTQLQKTSAAKRFPEEVIAESAEMKNVLSIARHAAANDSRILLEGESGTGKDVIARYIHEHSDRAGKVFLPVNCAAIPESLAEAEFFGYESGAFTGAQKGGKLGYFELADGGTLFLDEIGELPLTIQSKLLRILETSEVQRIGGRQPKKVSVRIIAATNVDLKKAIEKKTFRLDLYYRLNVLSLQIPPLRQRTEDILPLAKHYLDIFNKKYRSMAYMKEKELSMLQQYSFPGNVRELKNIVERYVITRGQLPQELLSSKQILTAAPNVNGVDISEMGLKQAMKVYERKCIQDAMEQAGNDVPAVAQILKIPVSTLYQKLRTM